MSPCIFGFRSFQNSCGCFVPKDRCTIPCGLSTSFVVAPYVSLIMYIFPSAANSSNRFSDMNLTSRYSSLTTYQQESVLNLIIHQKIPSVLVKLFRSFIDLPVSEYEPAVPMLVDLSTPEEGVPPPEDLVSVEEVGDVVSSIIRQFVQKQLILRRLLVEDTFFMIMRIVLAKPSESGEGAELENLKYLVWKQR